MEKAWKANARGAGAKGQYEIPNASRRQKAKWSFRIVKCIFGFRKTAYRGLKKNENRLYMLFAYLPDKRFLRRGEGVLRPFQAKVKYSVTLSFSGGCLKIDSSRNQKSSEFPFESRKSGTFHFKSLFSCKRLGENLTPNRRIAPFYASSKLHKKFEKVNKLGVLVPINDLILLLCIS